MNIVLLNKTNIMKQLLIILLSCFTLSASAQVQYVKDTTVAGTNLKLYPKAGAQKFDSIDVHPTLVGLVNKATSDVSGLQSTSSILSGRITTAEARITNLEQGIPIIITDTPKRINVTGSSYTISEGDNGANIFCYSTCTIYAGHGTDKYKVNIYRMSGAVTILPVSGISLLSVTGYRRIQQYGKAEVIYEGPARVLLTGNLTK